MTPGLGKKFPMFLELLFQDQAGSVQPRFDRARGYVKYLGNLLVGEAVQVIENHYRLMLG